MNSDYLFNLLNEIPTIVGLFLFGSSLLLLAKKFKETVLCKTGLLELKELIKIGITDLIIAHVLGWLCLLCFAICLLSFDHLNLLNADTSIKWFQFQKTLVISFRNHNSFFTSTNYISIALFIFPLHYIMFPSLKELRDELIK